MKIEAQIYLNDGRLPITLNWVCPYCVEGRLELDNARLRIEEYENSKKKRGIYDIENPWVEFESCCAGILKCNNKICGELVSFCGTLRGEDIECDDPSSETGTSFVYLEFIEPLFIHPSPHLIKMSSHYPKTVTAHLQESFRLFWVDKMSCANKLRVVVEDVLNHFKVKRTNKNRKPLTTHDRLEIFSKNPRFTDPARYLLAIKWIGNIGSHSGRFDDKVLESGFDFIEKALNSLFIKSDEELKKTREKIIRTKGRIR